MAVQPAEFSLYNGAVNHYNGLAEEKWKGQEGALAGLAVIEQWRKDVALASLHLQRHNTFTIVGVLSFAPRSQYADSSGLTARPLSSKR